MAHTKSAGSTKNARDSQPKYLGVKLFAGERAQPGSIIVRQRGTKFYPGKNVLMGKDHTLFATTKGVVRFDDKNRVTFVGRAKRVKVVSVV